MSCTILVSYCSVAALNSSAASIIAAVSFGRLKGEALDPDCVDDIPTNLGPNIAA